VDIHPNATYPDGRVRAVSESSVGEGAVWVEGRDGRGHPFRGSVVTRLPSSMHESFVQAGANVRRGRLVDAEMLRPSSRAIGLPVTVAVRPIGPVARPNGHVWFVRSFVTEAPAAWWCFRNDEGHRETKSERRLLWVPGGGGYRGPTVMYAYAHPDPHEADQLLLCAALDSKTRLRTVGSVPQGAIGVATDLDGEVYAIFALHRGLAAGTTFDAWKHIASYSTADIPAALAPPECASVLRALPLLVPDAT
jgi:hypothetical protein